MASNNQRVVTGKVRLSYANLLKPKAGLSGGEAKYSTTILIPKSDVATKQRIDEAIEATKQTGKNKWGGSIPPYVAVPIYDGDGTRPSDGRAFGDECKGHWVMAASSKIQPEIRDVNMNPILDSTEVYSGMYARVSFNFFAYSANGKIGIGAGLGNVQKLADGEPLGGWVTADEDFGAAPPAGDYNAQQQYAQQQNAPQQYAPPQQQNAPAPQYTPPQQQNAPAPQYAAPQQDTPPQQQNAPAPQYAAPQYTAPPQNTTPQQEYSTPLQYAAPPQYTVQQQYAAPQQDYSAPPQYAAPQQDYSAPSQYSQPVQYQSQAAFNPLTGGVI